MVKDNGPFGYRLQLFADNATEDIGHSQRGLT